MLGIQVSLHQNGKPIAKGGRDVQFIQGLGGQEVDCQDYHWYAGQHSLNGSCLQVPQTLDMYRVVINNPADQYCSASLC